MKSETTPNPGSDEALKQGCKCPVLDNGHGRGRGDGNFYITTSCPVHGEKPNANFDFGGVDD